MIAVPVFDIDAIRMWVDTPMPDTPARFSLWNQMRTDMEAAAEHIELLTAALLEARAQTKGFQ